MNLNFRDVYYQRQYDFLINLTPGFRWDMGNHWNLTGQVYVPVVNQYGDDGNGFMVNNLAISKQLRMGSLYCKTTAGLFSMKRYGLDVKLFLPLTDWFALEAQGGYVGWFNTDRDWRITLPDRFVGTVGGDIYIQKWNTQLRGEAGLYVYRDLGVEVEAMRHFNHTTVSLFGHWSKDYKYDAGFKIVVMIPPYHRTRRAVNFRPASNFRVAYSVMTNTVGNRMYRTDPEENEPGPEPVGKLRVQAPQGKPIGGDDPQIHRQAAEPHAQQHQLQPFGKRLLFHRAPLLCFQLAPA